AVTLTQPADALVDFGFAVTVSVDGAPFLERAAEGSFTARRETVRVAGVDVDPPFTEPGGHVNLSARVLTAVTQPRSGLVSFVVRDPQQQVVYTSSATPFDFTVASALQTVALVTVDTTGFAHGVHTITATVTEANGDPIAGASGIGTLLIGSPVTAQLS